MKIIQLQSENVKRIKVVSIKPDGSLVVIKGENEQGKSSVLDSIAYALGGEKLSCPEVIRRGEESAQVEVDLGDFIVTRRWSAAGSKLEVKSRDGARYPSPQKILDGLVGKLSFDPLEFSRAESSKQVETLRRLVGIDFSALDATRADLFAQRTQVNRDVANIKGALTRMPEVDAPDQPVSVAKLLAEQDRRLAQQHARDEAVRVAADKRSERTSSERAVAAAIAAVQQLEADLARARNQVAAKEAGLLSAQAAVLAAEKAAASCVAEPLGPIRDQLGAAEATNAKVRAKAARVVEVQKLAQRESDADALSVKIGAIDTQKERTLAAAQFPVPGLSFGDGGVTLDGLPLEQASSAARLRVSLAVGIAINPKLKVLLIREGSLLDEKSLATVGEMAERANAQVWIEVVGTKGPAGVVIEDGEVVGAPRKKADKPAPDVSDGAL